MRCILAFLALLAATADAVDADVRARLRAELPAAVQELAAAQERLGMVLARIQTPCPAPVSAALAQRAAAGQDWARRLQDPAQEVSEEQADRFSEELHAIRQHLDASADLAEQLAGLEERWPHSRETAEFARFRDFQHGRLLTGLAAAAGETDADADELRARQQRHHEVLLQVIEGERTAAERWALVPADAPALVAWRAHGRALQAAMERGAAHGVLTSGPDLDRDEAILGLLDEQVQVQQSRREHRTAQPVAADAPAALACQGRHDAEDAALQALVVHQRRQPHDEAWEREEERLRHAREHAARLSGLAEEWLARIADLPGLRKSLDERLAEAAPALRAQTVERWQELDTQRTASELLLAKALAAADGPAATRAGSELELARQRYDRLSEDLDLLRDEAAQDQAWREHTSAPGVAAAVKRVTAARAALRTARTSQRAQEEAAVRAELAQRLAELAADELRQAADQGQQAVERLREDLDRRVEETGERIEHPEPEPEKAGNF